LTLTLFFHLVWMLCALGAVVFAAAAARDRRRALGFGGGLIIGLILTRLGPPDPALAGGLAVGAVAIFLFRPRYADLAAMLGGVLAGLWMALLQAQGLPFLATAFAVAILSGVSAWLARSRPTFAPERLVDEGLLAIGALGIVALTLPSILDGWQTAVALAATSTRQASVTLPLWTVAFIVGCLSLGGVYSAWSRR
jgi:hypothetical protein